MAVSPTGLTVWTQGGGGTWVDSGTWGGGQASSLSTAFFFSGLDSRGRKFTGFKGMGYQVNASGQDLSNSLLFVMINVNGGIGATLAAGGIRIRVQDTSGNTSDWYVGGSDTYKGGPQLFVIDTANPESTNSGTAATLTAIEYVGIYLNASASSGGDPNVYVDQVLSCPNTGLTIGGNTTQLFDELAAWDETSLYTVIERRGSTIFSKAPLISNPDATGHASVDEALEIEEPVYHDGTNVRSALSALTFSSSSSNNTSITRGNITLGDNGDIVGAHATKTIDFSSATDIDLIDCSIKGANATSNAVRLGGSGNTITGVTFTGCGKVSDTGAVIRRAIFRSFTDSAGAYLWTENTDMENSSFFSDGTGHGVHYRPSGAGPFNTTFTDLLFDSFGAADTANAAVDINPVTNGADVTISIVGGSAITADETSPYTGTFTLIQAATVTFTGIPVGAEFRIYDDDGDGNAITIGTDREGIETTVSSTYVLTHDQSEAGSKIFAQVIDDNFEEQVIEVTLQTTNQSREFLLTPENNI